MGLLESKDILHVVHARWTPDHPLRRTKRALGKGVPAAGLVSELHPFAGRSEDHRVIPHHVAAANRVNADFRGGPLAHDAFTAVAQRLLQLHLTHLAEDLQQRKVIGRFSTFLEHVKPSQTGVRVTRFNALFHWAVPQGSEVRAGGEVGRHEILTHCYWREGGAEFNNVNIMSVAHGTDKTRVLEHKAAIDAHLAASGIPVTYTNVFWGGRSEIKPSEISPVIHREWLAKMKATPTPAL